MRRSFLGLMMVMVACSSRPEVRPQQETPKTSGDIVRLKSGESYSGRIVTVTQNDVILESDNRVRTFPKRDVAEISSPAKALTVSPSDPVRTSIPPSTWYPRTNPREAMLQVEVTFYEPHAIATCLGDLARAFEETPEVTLFAPPGGKIRLQDTRKWGYHAHVFPGDIVRKPAEKPGLLIDLPSDELPQQISFVSPAQEMKPADGTRMSYAHPDALVARVRDLSAADATLAAQPFAGRARDTKLGALWAFSLPRNERQFLVYLLDPAKKHGKVLDEAFASYGDALLAPDLMVDVLAADGAVLGRVMVLPMPPSLSADGPAPEPVTLRAGAEGYLLTTVPVPSRQSILLPQRAPSTRADIVLSCYEVSKRIPEKLTVAFGTDRRATVRSRAVTPDTCDEIVKIDLSSLKAEQFPAVAWLFHRRTYVWKDGGMLSIAPDLHVPRARADKPTQVISNAGRIPHVLPILFVGPDPSKGASLDGDLVGGMGSALLSDALGRESGAAFQALSTLSNIVDPARRTSGGGDGSSATSVTNIYITIPPHMSGLSDALTSIPTGTQLNYVPGNWGSGSAINPYIKPGQLGPNWAMSPSSVWDAGTGTLNNLSGNPVTYNPATGEMGSSDENGFGIDPTTFTPIWNKTVFMIKKKK